MHVHRVFHERDGQISRKDSGFWIMPADFNAARDMYRYLPELKNGHQVDADCDRLLMCGMPFYYPALSRLRKSIYLSGPTPKFHQPATLKLISQRPLTIDSRRLTFNLTGPSHLAVYMSAPHGVHLLKWSLGNNEPYPSLTWDNKPTYFVYYSYGELTEPWTFWVDLKIPIDYPKSDNIFDIAAVAHYLHGDDSSTPELKEFIKRLPDWVYTMNFPSTYQSWKF